MASNYHRRKMAEARNQDPGQSSSSSGASGDSSNKSSEETDECNPNQLVNRKASSSSTHHRLNHSANPIQCVKH